MKIINYCKLGRTQASDIKNLVIYISRLVLKIVVMTREQGTLNWEQGTVFVLYRTTKDTEKTEKISKLSAFICVYLRLIFDISS